jgi:hypothetical protein
MGHNEQGMAAKLQAIMAKIPEHTKVPVYNQDDVYVYDNETFEIIKVVGCNQPSARSYINSGVPAGYKACNGMEAARLGLWVACDSEYRFIDPKRKASNELAFSRAYARGAL